MDYLIKSATIIDPASPYHNQKLDILIQDGLIAQIGSNISAKGVEIINEENTLLSPGWIDISTRIGAPGFEEREDFESAAKAAVKGGFTTLCPLPNNNPVTDTRADVEFITQQNKNLPVNLFPFGSITRNTEGKELTELYEMFTAGALGFSDGTKPLQNPQILKLALEYTAPFKATVVNKPLDVAIAGNGQMNEGSVSTYLGLKGIPKMAEEIVVSRDLEIAEYTGGNLHLTSISSPKNIEKIVAAKGKGVQVTCDVPLPNLLFNESVLNGYPTTFKVMPPLRSEESRKTLIQQLKSGDIDCISIAHHPYDEERKNCEFEYASFGMATLEIAFLGYLKELADEISVDQWVELVAIKPRNIFDIPKMVIKEGFEADLTLFSIEGKTEVTKNKLASKGYNHPYLNSTLNGMIYGTFTNGVFNRA